MKCLVENRTFVAFVAGAEVCGGIRRESDWNKLLIYPVWMGLQ